VIELVALSEEELGVVVRRGAEVLETEVREEDAVLIAGRAGGDARAALQILELAQATADAEGSTLTEEHVLDAARKRPLLYDRKGDQHYDFASAFIKSMRGGDADASVYYLAAMLEAGEDPRFIARRMVILASEDVGNADPNALVVAVAAAVWPVERSMAGGRVFPCSRTSRRASQIAIAEALDFGARAR